MAADKEKTVETRNEVYTQLKLGSELHRKIKASAFLLGEEIHEFVSVACNERFDRLREEGRLSI